MENHLFWITCRPIIPSNDRERRANPRQGRGAPGSVAGQNDTVVVPTPHPHLPKNIKVEIISLQHTFDDAREMPSRLGEAIDRADAIGPVAKQRTIDG